MTVRAPELSPKGRLRLSRAECESILVRQGYECPECLEPISKYENYEIDHIVPVALGGTDDLDNLRALHAACHRQVKTPADIKAISKADSAGKTHAEHLEAMRTRTRRPSRRKRRERQWKESQRQMLETPRQE